MDQFRNLILIHTLAEFGRSIVEDIANDFNMLHKSISKSFIKSDPTLIEFLLELKRSYSLGIVTNGTTSWQQDKIDAIGIRSLFDQRPLLLGVAASCGRYVRAWHWRSFGSYKFNIAN